MKFKNFLFAAGTIFLTSCTAMHNQQQVEEITDIIQQVNNQWQSTHPEHGRAFWDNAAYHTGNMEVYHLLNDTAALNYSREWAVYNDWKGAKSSNREEWKYSYGESDEYVLFGDYQVCFQVYADLYNIDSNHMPITAGEKSHPHAYKIARAIEVMEYEMSTPNNDYWWWSDGLYMVMPVMTKLYNITHNPLYLTKLYEYWSYANSIMYDTETGLYYRDAKYVYPKHKSVNGKKDFWARGDGWVLL